MEATLSFMPFMPSVVSASHLSGYQLEVVFNDGSSKTIDFSSWLHGPVFELLKDPVAFRAFQIHPVFHTLVWANGADLAPEFLHDNVRVTA